MLILPLQHLSYLSAGHRWYTYIGKLKERLIEVLFTPKKSTIYKVKGRTSEKQQQMVHCLVAGSAGERSPSPGLMEKEGTPETGESIWRELPDRAVACIRGRQPSHGDPAGREWQE